MERKTRIRTTRFLVARRGRFAGSPSKGITLIELLIAVAIVAILGAIAIPAYDDYVVRGNRTELFAELQNCAMALERHFSANFTYEGAAAGGNDTGAPAVCNTQSPPTGTARYNIEITAASATAFLLEGDAVGAQAGDGDVRLASDGTRSWNKQGGGWVDDWDE